MEFCGPKLLKQFSCASHIGAKMIMKLKSHLIENIKRDIILEGVIQFSKEVIVLDARKYWGKFFGREIKTTMLAYELSILFFHVLCKISNFNK